MQLASKSFMMKKSPNVEMVVIERVILVVY